MLDFTALREKKQTLAELVAPLSAADLKALSNESVDKILAMIADCSDAEVVFQPVDPAANDTFASDPSVANLAWSLGHVIVHTTASAEESAFLAAEQARGVEFHGRSRYETPWESVTTIEQCRQRLEESRRMRLASLEVWPEQPHLNNTVEMGFLPGPVNPLGRFVIGLMHEESHYAQIAEIVRQAQITRS